MSVMSQMMEESHEWQCRVEKAEAEVERLRTENGGLKLVVDSARIGEETASKEIERLRAALEQIRQLRGIYGSSSDVANIAVQTAHDALERKP